MASLMEKDAMIEIIAGTMAHMFRHQDKYGETKNTRKVIKSLSEKRIWVYSTSGELINYDDFIIYKNQIKENYPDE